MVQNQMYQHSSLTIENTPVRSNKENNQTQFTTSDHLIQTLLAEGTSIQRHLTSPAPTQHVRTKMLTIDN